MLMTKIVSYTELVYTRINVKTALALGCRYLNESVCVCVCVCVGVCVCVYVCVRACVRACDCV